MTHAPTPTRVPTLPLAAVCTATRLPAGWAAWPRVVGERSALPRGSALVEVVGTAEAPTVVLHVPDAHGHVPPPEHAHGAPICLLQLRGLGQHDLQPAYVLIAAHATLQREALRGPLDPMSLRRQLERATLPLHSRYEQDVVITRVGGLLESGTRLTRLELARARKRAQLLTAVAACAVTAGAQPLEDSHNLS